MFLSVKTGQEHDLIGGSFFSEGSLGEAIGTPWQELPAPPHVLRSDARVCLWGWPGLGLPSGPAGVFSPRVCPHG